jgi:hypothetical protein
MDSHKLHDSTKAFVLKSGQTLHSIKDLYGHLNVITDDEFGHHVKVEKNDFALWIEHAHGDKFLAAAIRQAPSKDGMRKVLFMAMFK